MSFRLPRLPSLQAPAWQLRKCWVSNWSTECCFACKAAAVTRLFSCTFSDSCVHTVLQVGGALGCACQPGGLLPGKTLDASGMPAWVYQHHPMRMGGVSRSCTGEELAPESSAATSPSYCDRNCDEKAATAAHLCAAISEDVLLTTLGAG